MSQYQSQDQQADITGDHINQSDLAERLGMPIRYEDLVKRFKVQVPETYNMAEDTVLRQAAGPLGEKTALICEAEDGDVQRYSYRDLDEKSARLATYFRDVGVGKGDVVACFLSQGLEAALTYLAAFRIGAIVAPLSQLYGPDAMRHALQDAQARILIADAPLWARLKDVVTETKALKAVLVTGDAVDGTLLFNNYMGFDAEKGCVPTSRDDPALLLYTSGSTGMPKGILHAHRILRGYLASVSLFYELQMEDCDQVLWTVSDWSWVAGIFNVMLTGWYFGQTVVASRVRFDPEGCFDLMQRHGVTHCFLTPTALKRMARIEDPKTNWPRLAIRAIGTGGEPLPSSVLGWADSALDVPINEFYGLTEVNHLIGNCRSLYPIKPGSMGRAYPGHVMAVIDEAGNELPDGEVGEFAAREDDPTLFLGYWNQPERTTAMKSGNLVRTGDFGHRDKDGYFWYQGRQDDLIKSAGYRIGPAEIEDSLLHHVAVAEVAVIGIPDAERGKIVKAIIRLADGYEPSDPLVKELQAHVKNGLAFYKYPREIEFVKEFPLTSTGKINRKLLREENG